jgi:hypothetical protein
MEVEDITYCPYCSSVLDKGDSWTSYVDNDGDIFAKIARCSCCDREFGVVPGVINKDFVPNK